MSDLQTVRRAQFFTSARRIPILFGKLPNGGRVWGGPYTLLQISVGSLVLVVGYNTRALWGAAVGSPLIQLLLLVIVAAGATWFTGRIPSGTRKLGHLLIGAVGALSVPGTGTYRGARIILPRPHRVTGTVLLKVPADSAPAVTPLKESLHDAIAVPTPLRSENTAVPIPARAHPAHTAEDASVGAVPDSVIALPTRRTYTSGLDRLLEQARRMESN